MTEQNSDLFPKTAKEFLGSGQVTDFSSANSVLRVLTAEEDLHAANIKEYGNVKNALIARFENAVSAGKVYWEKAAVVDRSVNIEGLQGYVRYVPTFAYRRTIYDKEHTYSKCRLCEAFESGEVTIPLPKANIFDQDFMQAFESAFVVCLNNFPYLDGQLLLASRQHSTVFTPEQYLLLFEFMKRIKFAGASLQVKGSGATIPEHAHISIFNEVLPIFLSSQQALTNFGETNITISSEHPSVCYKIAGGSSEKKLKQTNNILDKLTEHNLSFNLYVDESANIYIIPRTNRRSASLNWKVGSSLPAGIHNGYIEQSQSHDIQGLKREIWDECNSITEIQLITALRETTYQGDPIRVLSPHNRA